MSIIERREAVCPQLFKQLNRGDCRLFDCASLGYAVGSWNGTRWRIDWFDKMCTLKGSK